MDAERVRAIVKKFPYLVETVQWGETLVFWVGDKAIGGKMFALVNMEGDGKAVMSLSAGPEHYAELLENEGVIPAPYMARIYWVALEHWDALNARELATHLAHAHALTYAKLPKRTRDTLALPAAECRKLIADRRKALAAAKTAAGEPTQRVSPPPKLAKKSIKKLEKMGSIQPSPDLAGADRKTKRGLLR